MKLDNSKRMAALTNILKEEKKKDKDKKKKKPTSSSTKNSSVITPGSSTKHSSTSNGSKGSGSGGGGGAGQRAKQQQQQRFGLRRRNSSQECSAEENNLMMEEPMCDFISPKHALLLQKSWEDIRRNHADTYRTKVGEEVFLAMWEINPRIRQDLGITGSLASSPGFATLCERLTQHVEFFVNMAGPSASQEFLDIRHELVDRDRIDPQLLADAIPKAIKNIMDENGDGERSEKFTPVLADVWGYTFAKHILRMTTASD